MVKLKDPIRIIGILAICSALFFVIKNTIYNIQIIGLTPEKCTEEIDGTVVDYVSGSQMQYGKTRGHSYSVYYDIIEYEVNGHKYQLKSRHAYTGKPVIGATTTVHYNPNDPSKAYDNSEPYKDNSGYYTAVVSLIVGLIFVFRIDRYFSAYKN